MTSSRLVRGAGLVAGLAALSIAVPPLCPTQQAYAAPAARQAPTQPAAPGKRGDELGFQQRFPGDLTTFDGIVEKIGSFGVKWVRMYWNWSWVEGSRGRRYMKPIQIAVDAAHKRGMKIIVLATGAPAWANGGKMQDFPPTDDAVADFAAYAAAIAAETGADAIEVWNEPNNKGFWASGPDPVKMARLQVAAYRAIKAARPETVVITGGLTQVPSDPETFFAKMLAADAEFARSFDAVGLHPYNEPDDPLVPGSSKMKNIMTVQAPAIHRMLVERGRPDVPIWFTEYGVATYGQWSVSEARQAVYLSRFFQGVADMRAGGIPVGVSILYMLQDSSPYKGTSEQPFFGILRVDGTEKPAAAVVRDYANPRE